MQKRLKAAFGGVRARAEATFSTAAELAPQWTTPDLLSPEEMGGLLAEVDAARNARSRARQMVKAAREIWAGAARQWHESSVAVAAIGRVTFKNTPHAPLWARLRATGQSRDLVLREGRAIENAWQQSNPAWIPKPGLSLADYQALRTAAEAAAAALPTAQTNSDLANNHWRERTNALHELCVNWYAIARATFPEDSVEGRLVRQVLNGIRRHRKPQTALAAPPPAAAA